MTTKTLLIAATTLLLLVPVEGFAQHCDCPHRTDDDRAAYNALLELTEREIEITDATHLPFGIPTVPPGDTCQRL